MPRIARIPITNFYADGDYTGCLLIGPGRKPLNLLLDSGSSTLALNRHKYRPDTAGGDVTTDLVQFCAYGDGSSFTGAVIQTVIRAGTGRNQITVEDANAAVAYHQSADMFGKCDGILGLAYAALNDAYEMKKDTWRTHYRRDQFYKKRYRSYIQPFPNQMTKRGVVADIFAFYTQRSFVHLGRGPKDDPLNKGWLILGGGKECKDLYTGRFQVAKVMSEDYYDTNLKAVIVGRADPIPVKPSRARNAPATSIVDSGTQTLDIAPALLRAILSKFPDGLRQQLSVAVYEERLVRMGDLNLKIWPDITFVLEGESHDVKLTVSPYDYWQVNAQHVGMAVAAISKGDPGQTILGLPAMNGYFTIFDGEAAGGRGVIRFARSKRPRR